MSNEIENLLLHHLKAIRADVHSLKSAVSDLASQVISVRKQLINMDGNEIRQDEAIAELHLAVDRINSTLGISDMPDA